MIVLLVTKNIKHLCSFENYLQYIILFYEKANTQQRTALRGIIVRNFNKSGDKKLRWFLFS